MAVTDSAAIGIASAGASPGHSSTSTCAKVSASATCGGNATRPRIPPGLPTSTTGASSVGCPSTTSTSATVSTSYSG